MYAWDTNLVKPIVEDNHDEVEVTSLTEMRAITNMEIYKTVNGDYFSEVSRQFETTASRQITLRASNR